MNPRLTVGELRAILAGRPDDELVTVYTADWYYHPVEVTVPTDDDDGQVTVVITVNTDDGGTSFDTRFDI